MQLTLLNNMSEQDRRTMRLDREMPRSSIISSVGFALLSIIRPADKLGGSDKKDWKVYKVPSEKSYYDKKDHSERSKYHQPNHKKHK